jgi:hypothetical protein
MCSKLTRFYSYCKNRDIIIIIYITCSIFILIVLHMPCLQDTALPEDGSRGDVPPVRLWRAAACRMNSRRRTTRDSPPDWVLDVGLTTPHPRSALILWNITECITLGQSLNGCVGCQLQASTVFIVWPLAPGAIMIGGWIGHIYLFCWK